MDKKIIGKKSEFAIGYCFYDTTKETELEMYIKGKNILEFKKNGLLLTTKWNLDDLVFWLRNFIDRNSEEPFPYDVKGKYAAEKDMEAREFDSDNDEEFDKYYDTLDEWDDNHRWHRASAGAILADVYFQFIGGTVEISWNNNEDYDGAVFTNRFGGDIVDKNIFVDVTNEFICAYAKKWFR